MRPTRLLPLLLALAGSASASAQDDLQPADVGVLGAAQPLLPVEYQVEVVGEGPVYQAVAHLQFRNPRLRVVEGVALVPMPAGAIPRGVLVVNGATKMRGVVRSRTRAVDAYRRITRGSGRDPAIVEQLGDRWLRATLSPVAADDSVELQVRYLGFADRVGGRRLVALPSPRRALRSGGADGVAPSWLDEAGAASAASGAWTFRAPGEEGYFCVELDPSAELSTPLPRPTVLLVVETPESTPPALARAAGAVLSKLAGELGDDAKVELFDDRDDDARGGLFNGFVPADAEARAALAERLAANEPRGWGRLEARVERALASAESLGGPVRLVVASSQRRIARREPLLAAIERAAALHGDDFSCFTVAIGSAAETTTLADAARVGRGRAFVLPAAEEGDVACVGAALAAAARRPVLRLPQVDVAGSSELVVEERAQVTYGETLRAVGRYDEARTTLARLAGFVRGARVAVVRKVELPDEEVTHPWVATIWAGLRARQLRRDCTGTQPDDYVTRLCERFGLLGPETVSLSLEPALSDRMPPLVGAPGQPVTQLDPPVVPTPPNPETPTTGEPRDPRRTVPTNTPNGPLGNPSPLPPPPAHPTLPSQPPLGPPPARPGPGHGR
jgi:hypothetical protein